MPITNFLLLVFNIGWLKNELNGLIPNLSRYKFQNWCRACEKWCKNTITACHFYAKMKKKKTSQMCIKNATLVLVSRSTLFEIQPKKSHFTIRSQPNPTSIDLTELWNL